MSSVTRVAIPSSVIKSHPLRPAGRASRGLGRTEELRQVGLGVLLDHPSSCFADNESQDPKNPERHQRRLNRAEEIRSREQPAEYRRRKGDQRETAGKLSGHNVVPSDDRENAGQRRRHRVAQSGSCRWASMPGVAGVSGRRRLGAGKQVPVDHLSAIATGSFRISCAIFGIGNFDNPNAAYAAR